MIPQEINERLCKLMYDVWRRIDPNATTANDCYCNRGGLWKSPHYGPDDFRNDGKALEFVELAVAEKFARMDAESERKRPWAADGDDFDNWYLWLRRQPGGMMLGSLYAIMCRLADGEGKA